MLKTVKTRLTKNDIHHQESHLNKPVRLAHFVNGYIKQERKKKRKAFEEDGTSSQATESPGEIALTYNLMYIPRILKNDLRRQYPIMFAHVFNSCDYDLMMKFLNEFCDLSGRVTLSDTYTSNGEISEFSVYSLFHESLVGPPCILTGEVQGLENCEKLWSYSMSAQTPDLCFQLQTVQIRVRSDGTCTCEAKHKCSGTAIIYVNPKKIPKILRSCGVNDAGILVLPNLPSPGILVRQTKLQNSETETDSFPSSSSSTSLSSSSSSSSSSTDELLISELKELYEIDHQLLSDFVHSLQGDEESKENVSIELDSSSFDEESEYLFSVFTDFMQPERITPRKLNSEDTLPLGFPYECTGDLLIHVNEESKIFHLDLRSTFVTQ